MLSYKNKMDEYRINGLTIKENLLQLAENVSISFENISTTNAVAIKEAWRCCGRADYFTVRIQKGYEILRADVSEKKIRRDPRFSG